MHPDFGSELSDMDQELTIETLRLEDALNDYQGEGSAHIRMILQDTDELADALFSLWSQSKEANPAWKNVIIRVYRFACDVVEQLEDMVLTGQDMEVCFKLLSSYSSLFIDGLIDSKLTAAIVSSINQPEMERLQMIAARVRLLKWSLDAAEVRIANENNE